MLLNFIVSFEDWLPRDIADPIRIIGIEYPSYLLAFTGTMESLQVNFDVNLIENYWMRINGLYSKIMII